jgi:2-haloacid dehalogenase
MAEYRDGGQGNPIDGIAFDAFGTLFDLEAMRERIGDDLYTAFSRRLIPWTWHLTATGGYRPFPEVAALALAAAAREAGEEMSDASGLVRGLRELPPFPEVAGALAELDHVPLAILTNGTPDGAAELVRRAGLEGRFAHLLSVDAVRRFKPAAEVYALAPEAFATSADRVLLVSGNDWDVAGAQAAGLRGAWVARGRSWTGALGAEPDVVVETLADLPARIG